MLRSIIGPFRLIAVLGRHRFLVRQLVGRAFVSRQAGMVLGWAWSLVTTAVQLAVLWWVFGTVLGMRSAEGSSVSFGIFLMAGLVPFTAFQEGLVTAVGVFRSNVSLVQRIRIPLEVLVVSEVVGVLAHKAIAMAVVVGVCAAAGTVDPPALGWTLAGLLVLSVWIIGGAMVVSVAGAFLPDAAEVLSIGLQLLFYMTPIVYPMAMIHGTVLARIVEANPLTVLVQAVRAGLVGGVPPRPVVLAAVAASGYLVMVLGTAAMDRWRLRIPDVL